MGKYNIVIKVPHHRSGVYVIYNPVKNMAYVGEGDVCARLSSHLGSICLGENTSNEQLIQEDEKSFIILSVINSSYNKKDTNTQIRDKDKEWIVHETIVMYVLKKLGIELYNGNSYGQDNEGFNRKCLIDEPLPENPDELKSNVFKYLGIQYDSVYWNGLISDVEQELVNSMFKVIDPDFDGNIKCLSKGEWKDRIKAICEKDSEWEIIEKDSDCRAVRNKLRKQYLTKNDFDAVGVEPMTTEELNSHIDNGDLDRVVFHKFGKYVGQTLTTIFGLKLNDIKNARLGDLKGLDIDPSRKDQGVCLWALRNLNVVDVRNNLSESVDDKGPRYMIMLYTSSNDKYKPSEQPFDAINPLLGEPISDFAERFKKNKDLKTHFPAGYVKPLYDQKDSSAEYRKADRGDEIYEFPSDLVPPFIDKSGKRNVALIVSDIKYVDAHYKAIEDLEDFYVTYDGRKFTGIKPLRHINAKLHNDNEDISVVREQLKKYIVSPDSQNSDSDFVSFLVAKLEYPYIVTLVDENRLKT